MMTTAADLHQKLFEMLETGGLDRLGEVAHDDCECTMPGMEVQGVEAIRGLLTAYATAFPDQKHSVVRRIVDGDTAAVELTWRGTHTGTFATPMGERPPTGNTIDLTSTDIVVIRDGKIASWHAYYDPTSMMIGIGAIPQPTPA